MGEIPGRERNTMLEQIKRFFNPRYIRPRESIEFEWREKARHQMVDSIMNAETDIEFFNFRLRQEKNNKEGELNKRVLKTSIKDKIKELEKVEFVFKVIDQEIRG